MALKKGILDKYIKEREKPALKSSVNTSSKYSHNRVFDEPPSLKKAIDSPQEEKSEKVICDEKYQLELNRFQTVSTQINNEEITLSEPIKETKISCKNDTLETDSNGFKRFQTVSNQTDSTLYNKFKENPSGNNKKSELLISEADINSAMFHEEHLEQDSNGFKRSQTDAEQTDSLGFKRFQTVSIQTDSNGFNRTQTVSETVSKLPSLSELKVLYYFQEIRSRMNPIMVQRQQIANELGLKLAGIKTALNRLKNKGYIKLLHCSKGRYTGYTSYELTNEALKILASPQTIELLGFKRFQTVSQTVSSSSYSSSKDINTTTYLPDEWKKINYVLLSHIGFSETQLRQLYDANTTTVEIVQDSINRFSYSLEHSDKVKAYSDPLNVLMGVLRKGQKWNEPNYVPPKELALRKLLEEKRKEKEHRDAMIKELVDIEFPAWRKQLTKDEIKKIIPEETLKLNLAPAITAALRTHYIDNVLLPKIMNNNLMDEEKCHT